MYFINNFCWTYDPRLEHPYIPFELFEHQQEYIDWLTQRYENKERGIAEKSRDVGFSWLNCAWLLHRLLFGRGFKGTLGSRKVDLVDVIGDPDSLMEKIRMMLRWLPEDGGVSLPQIKSKYLRLENVETGSVITGEGGDQMGRGGRSSVYIMDEAAFVERPHLVEAAVSANTEVLIKVSTPNGMGNPFEVQRHSGNYPVFTFHWSQDPRKNQEWYEKQKRELDPIIVAQEIDIDYYASTPGVLIPHEWIMSAVEFPINTPSGLTTAGFDVADDGSANNVLIISDLPRVSHITSWTGLSLTESAFRSINESRHKSVNVINFDAVGIGASVGETYKNNPHLFDTNFRWNPVKTGNKPTRTWWNAEKRWSEQKFSNLRAELGWRLRERFRKTHDMKQGVYVYPHDELISIPYNAKLITDLSVMRFSFTSTGLIQLESKKDMQKRNVKSPDFYDALALAFFVPASTPAQTYQTVW